MPSHELADEAGLSESRFLHLFRDQLGTSLRRYRIWVRLVHLADRFKSTFGLSAS